MVLNLNLELVSRWNGIGSMITRLKVGSRVKISKKYSGLIGWRKEFEYKVFTIVEIVNLQHPLRQKCMLNNMSGNILADRLELVKPGEQLEWDW